MYAKYTEYLKDIMENVYARPLLDKALSSYPLYENTKKYDLIPTREELNQKILNHYKYREIGFETVGRFLDELEITMNEIMPHYNELFKTIVTMAELPSPFDNVDVTETFDEERTGSSKNESSGTSNANTSNTENESNEHYGKKVHSETPGNSLDLAGKDIDKVDYADNIDWDSDEENNERTGNSETTTATTQSDSGETSSRVTHTYHKIGNQGVNTYAHDMNEFRTSIMDVVDEIINDNRLNELFMLVF